MIKANLLGKESIRNGIISIAIFILTFPKFEPDFTTGLDSPYMWALNYLFLNNYEFLKHLIFPIGILGFLKHPVAVGNCVLYAVIFFSFVKLLFIFLMLKLAQAQSLQRWMFNALMVLIAAIFINIDFAIIFCNVLLLYFFSCNRRHLVFILAVLLGSLGLFIKSSIGVNSLGVIFIFLIYDYYLQRNIKQTAILIAVSAGVFLIVGLTLFQSLSLFVNAIWSILMLVKGYSSALALFPDNSWILLSLFFLTTLSIPLLFKEKESRMLFYLMLFPLFLMWKYSILREEPGYFLYLLNFTIVLWAVIIISAKRINPVFYFLPIVSIASLWGNLKYIDSSASININYLGIKNFTEVVFDYSGFIERNRRISEENIKPNLLSDGMLKEIGQTEIDIYPWDFSYVSANKLNWKPRTTFQSVTFSSWVDKQSTLNFQKASGPNYILFHEAGDGNYGRFGAIDNRHILSEEPQTIIEIFNRYNIVRKEDGLLLLEKDSIEKLLPSIIVKTDTITWNKWVEVPLFDDAIIRAKLGCKGNIINKLKTFFYKGEALFVDFKLDNGREISYGIVESSANDGVWVDPFIQNPFNNFIEPTVVGIRFRSSNTILYNSTLIINWEKIGFKNASGNAALTLFGKDIKEPKEILVDKCFDFEGTENGKLSNKISHSGNMSNIVKADGFSQGYEFLLDTIWNDSISSIDVEADVYYNSYKVKNGVLVLSLENSGENDFWESRKLDISNNDWNYAFIRKRINKTDYSKGCFKVYVCNPNKKGGCIYIDDLRVRIVK